MTPTITDRIIEALDNNARSTRYIAARVGLPVSQVGPILQALAVGPIRGIATARGNKLVQLSAAKPKVRKSFYPSNGPLWMRGAAS